MLVGISAVLVLVAFLATLSLARYAATSALGSERSHGQDLVRITVPAIGDMMERHDLVALRDYLGVLAGNRAVSEIHLTDTADIKLFEYSGETPSAGWLTRLLHPDAAKRRSLGTDIRANGQKIGRLEITLSNAPVNESVSRIVANSAMLTAALLAITIVLVYVSLARFTAPLRPLTQWAREFSRGNWKPKVKLLPSKSREIRELNQAMASGSEAMQHYIRSLFEARELLEHSENRLRNLINGMHEILFELDTNGRITFLNPAWERLTGFKIDDALGKPIADFLLDEDVIRDFGPRGLDRLSEKSREIAMRTASGRRLWVSLEADAQMDSGGDFTGIIGTLGDITKSIELNRLLSRYQDELYHMSVTDPLTGLYNRRHFDTQLEVILSDHLPKQRSVCLLLIDLDGFKFINDTYGHPLGDEVLRTTAYVLKHLVRRNDYIARMAGDEFAMVLKNTDLANATRIAQKVHARMSQTRIPLPVGHMQLQCSIGVAEAPTHGENAQDLISAADVALYHSKRRGRNHVEVLSPDTSKAVMSIFSQGFELRNALDQGNIHPAFQPIYEMRSGKPLAYEVLARMRLNGAVIQAQDFIAVAEELGLTRDVDLHIIGSALNHTPPDQALFLNVDLTSFNDRDYVNELAKLLKPACESGRSITIEITEREAIPLSDGLRGDIGTLRALGCKLALDDFGSGYSTYNFLNQFRPDYLKIEGSFVRGMLTNEADRKIVMHIHELAMSFGMETIAESVENEETHKALQEIGIRNAQGLLYGAPQFTY